MALVDRFKIPTALPKSSQIVRNDLYVCVACWQEVKGSEYDFENELCLSCNRALIHVEMQSNG